MIRRHPVAAGNTMTPENWVRTTLGNLGDLRNGVNFNRTQEGPGIPVLKVKDFGNRTLVPSQDLDELDTARISIDESQMLNSGDVVIIRSNGNSALVGRSLFCSDHLPRMTFSGFCIRFRPEPNRIDQRFAAYFVRSPACRQRFSAYGSGTGIQNLSQGIIGGVPIDLPPVSEQRAIAHILGTLDDRIELNRRTNQTLEEIARTLFKSWFVDFDPVRAKAEGRPPEGMDAETAALFPDAFEESELGPIPEGWAIEPLDALAAFRNGLALQRYRPEDDTAAKLPVVKIAHLRAGQASTSEWASALIDPECILDDGDVVFSWSGSLLVVLWCGGQAALNQHLFKVTSAEYPKWFYYHWLLEHLPWFQRIASGKATTMGHIQRHHLNEAQCVVPPLDLVQRLDVIFEPLLDERIAAELEARTLARVRDALLPKLLSGDLRIDDPDEFLEENVP